MNKQTQLIQNSLPLIAAGLGDKLGVRVTVSGNQAYASAHHNVINIPDFIISSKEQKDAVLGYLSHEAAHFKFDSFKASHRISSQAVHNYWNIFEDMRIELAMIDKMVGTKIWMNQIWINRQNEGQRLPITEESTPPQTICELLLMTCRVNYRGQTHLQPYLDAAEGVFCYHFGLKFYMELMALLENRLPLITSSDEACDLAEEVHNLVLNFEPEEENDESESSDDEGDEQSEDSDPKSSDGEEGEQDAPGHSNEMSDTDSETEASSASSEEEDGCVGSSNQGAMNSTQEGDSESDNSAKDVSSTSTSSGSGQPSSEQIKAAIEAVMTSQEEFDDMSAFAGTLEQLAEENPEQHTIALPDVRNVKPIQGSHCEVEKTVNATSNQLTAKLMSIVEHDMRVRCKTKTSGMHLNSKVLSRYAVDDPRVFKQKAKKRQIDTVVEVCLDNSYSMTSMGLMTTAKNAQMALVKALARINGVSVSASAFPKNRASDGVENLLNEGENVRNLAMRYHEVEGLGDSTPTAQAMWHCIRTVLSSNKSNKVIIVITDGYPNGNEQRELKRLVQKATYSGITVIGVAIGQISSSKPEFYQYFPNALFIQDIKELKQELFKVAKDILVSK